MNRMLLSGLMTVSLIAIANVPANAHSLGLPQVDSLNFEGNRSIVKTGGKQFRKQRRRTRSQRSRRLTGGRRTTGIAGQGIAIYGTLLTLQAKKRCDNSNALDELFPIRGCQK